MGQVISLHLEGPDAEFGKIPASDVARLLDGWERALGRAAEARMRRQARTGRRPRAVERATHLIFRDIERGSVIAVLEIPDPRPDEDGSGSFDLDDAHLGELASDDALALLLDPDRADADEGLIDALLQLSTELGIGSRYDALEISVDRGPTAAPNAPRRATLTPERREQLSQRRDVLRQRAEDGTVVGTLVEADFERHTARVLTSDQRGVAVTFRRGSGRRDPKLAAPAGRAGRSTAVRPPHLDRDRHRPGPHRPYAPAAGDRRRR
jgi:hypothetical protein